MLKRVNNHLRKTLNRNNLINLDPLIIFSEIYSVRSRGSTAYLFLRTLFPGKFPGGSGFSWLWFRVIQRLLVPFSSAVSPVLGTFYLEFEWFVPITGLQP